MLDNNSLSLDGIKEKGRKRMVGDEWASEQEERTIPQQGGLSSKEARAADVTSWYSSYAAMIRLKYSQLVTLAFLIELRQKLWGLFLFIARFQLNSGFLGVSYPIIRVRIIQVHSYWSAEWWCFRTVKQSKSGQHSSNVSQYHELAATIIDKRVRNRSQHKSSHFCEYCTYTWPTASPWTISCLLVRQRDSQLWSPIVSWPGFTFKAYFSLIGEALIG